MAKAKKILSPKNNSSKRNTSRNLIDSPSTSNAEDILTCNSPVQSTSTALTSLSTALENFRTKCNSDNEECASLIRQEVQRALSEHFTSVSNIKQNNSSENNNQKTVPSEEKHIQDSFRHTSESILHFVDKELAKHQLMFEAKWTDFTRNIESLSRSITKLELDLDELNQYGRRSCLILHGYQFKDNENLLNDIPQFFADKLKINLSSKDLVAVHRLPQFKRNSANNESADSRRTPAKPAPIIVKFVHMDTRNQVYFNKKIFKNTPFLITENLTKRRSELLKAVRDERFISWTFNGTIFVIDNNNRRRKISTLQDLQKLAHNLKKF